MYVQNIEIGWEELPTCDHVKGVGALYGHE
jgi:hypothetical protein